MFTDLHDKLIIWPQHYREWKLLRRQPLSGHTSAQQKQLRRSSMLGLHQINIQGMAKAVFQAAAASESSPVCWYCWYVCTPVGCIFLQEIIVFSQFKGTYFRCS